MPLGLDSMHCYALQTTLQLLHISVIIDILWLDIRTYIICDCIHVPTNIQYIRMYVKVYMFL